MSNASPSTETKMPLHRVNDDVDLRQLIAALCRHKVLIGGITFGASLLSGVYAFTSKPVWEGSFQIVLGKQDGGYGGLLAQYSVNNPLLADLGDIGAGSGESSLATEVKILESPSLLKPTYDYVKLHKDTSGENISNWSYTNWVKSNLSIELIKKLQSLT